jgi:hypothetical protein
VSNEPLRSKQHAQRDLNYIRTLREAEAFNAYWLRRVKQRRDSCARSFLHDPPTKVDKDKREALRLILLEYDWLIDTMMVEDETACRQILTTQPTAQGGQGQPGMG